MHENKATYCEDNDNVGKSTQDRHGLDKVFMPRPKRHSWKEAEHSALETPDKGCVRVPSHKSEFRAQLILADLSCGQIYETVSECRQSVSDGWLELTMSKLTDSGLDVGAEVIYKSVSILISLIRFLMTSILDEP